MMPASFAIPYLLTAPLPPSLTVDVLPAADAACRPTAQACFAPIRLRARNRSNRTLVMDGWNIVLSREGRSGYHLAPNPRTIPPFGEVKLPDAFELHVDGHHELEVRYHAEGERQSSRRMHVTVMSEHWLYESAYLACRRCDVGVSNASDDCSCKTRDAGRRCTSATQCESACLFDRFERLPDPVCPPGALTRCPTYAAIGFRVGNCSKLKVPVGCFDILTAADSESRPISLLSGSSRTCWNDVELITESSRRR